jgi:rhodanese-related sulfurtransferase
VHLNKHGYESIDTILEKGTLALEANDFERIATETGAVVLDVRNEKDFVKEHIPNAIFIGIDGGFAPWVGALIGDVKKEILLITPEGREAEVVTRLARVGFDHTLGYLKGGIEAWKAAGKETDSIRSISAQEFEKEWKETQKAIFDVRKEGEFQSEHLVEATHTPLDLINTHLAEFPKTDNFYIHCAGGYRSVIAASILKSRGIHNLIDVAGGYNAIKNTDLERTSYVCPSTLK